MPTKTACYGDDLTRVTEKLTVDFHRDLTLSADGTHSTTGNCNGATFMPSFTLSPRQRKNEQRLENPVWDAALALLSGCAESTGILPMGPDTYTLSEHYAPIRGGAVTAGKVALTERPYEKFNLERYV